MAKRPATASIQASVLSFERHLDPSDAIFASGAWDDRANGNQWPAVRVREKSIRGTVSNRPKGRPPTKEPMTPEQVAKDAAKSDAAIESPNIQKIDVATLPECDDTLRVRFTLRILGHVGTPAACNNSDYRNRLATVVSGYIAEHGFHALAPRYAQNLANARFLWRNRIAAEQVEVRIRHLVQGVEAAAWTFDALKVPLRDFMIQPRSLQALTDVAAVISTGFSERSFTLLEVVAYARVGAGQEVFPSQEFIRDPGDPKKGGKSKTLYTLGGTAAMHSQKIGNAVRTIDTDYPGDVATIGPIAIEPYGSVTSHGRAYRDLRSKLDFYTLFDNWMLHDIVPPVNHQHYVIATLIRGGVFGESEKSEKKGE